MMASTQGNRDTNGYQILDIKLQIKHILGCGKETSQPAKQRVFIFCDHSEFLVLLEMWNSAGKAPFYFLVRIMGSLSLLFVLEVPKQ